MENKTLLILERSSQNLQKITRNGKIILEGVFAEFGIENRNGRIYEEKEYLPHLEYLKKDIANGNLLGELDHPERFEVSLSNVSHRVTDLWYDPEKRQVLGRVEILEGTPKGQIAKALLEAGVALSISSRAAGTVNEDKTVSIQQIYTYDLVAKPGFESAQLHKINESNNPYKEQLKEIVQSLNESYSFRKSHSLSKEFGILNENISILDLTDKYPQIQLREEAKRIIKNNDKKMNVKENLSTVNEEAIQKWTELFKTELSNINERLDEIEKSNNTDVTREINAIKRYVEKLRKIQEDALNWQSEIAKAVNEVANYADTLARRSNKHYELTNKIAETVDYNAKILNKTQDWTSEIAKVVNVTANVVDHNAEMLNGINEWNTKIAKAVNKLNEWGEEKAKAINALHEWGEEKAKAINALHDWVSSIAKATNGMHEWTSSIAKNLNYSINWAEDMFGRAISKEEARRILEYVETVAESNENPELKEKIYEMLRTNSITAKPLNEAKLKGIEVLDTDNLPKMKAGKTDDLSSDNNGIEIDSDTGAILSKIRDIKIKREKLPLGNDKLQMDPEKKGGSFGKQEVYYNGPKELRSGLSSHQSIKIDKMKDEDGPTSQHIKNQRLKLDVKGESDLNEKLLNRLSDIKNRKADLNEKLDRIIRNLEKERRVDEEIKSQYPFTALLSAEDRKRFAELSVTDKQKVAKEVSKVPTTDSNVIKQLWENALAQNVNNEPLWLKLAPKAYKEAYKRASDELKESIKARAEFYTLNTQYQIENFWETSGLIKKPEMVLNEAVYIKNPEENEQKLDTFVASIGEYMKNRYL